MLRAFAIISLLASAPAFANDWSKFYTPLPGNDYLMRSAQSPEVVPSSGNLDRDLEAMWRRGFAPLGYTQFSSPNAQTKDAERHGKKIGARYIIAATALVAQSTTSMPWQSPTTTTSHSSGTASVSGTGGFATGSFNGTTTTYGSQTTYIPMTVSRFDKMAVYFAEVPKKGTGIRPRELTPDEMRLLDTRKGFAVLWVRDGSPAYDADIFPGDLIVGINGKPADDETWRRELSGAESVEVDLIRNEKRRSLTVSIPAEWQS